MAWIFETFSVGRMMCDTPKWESEIEQWAVLYGDEVVLGIPTYSADAGSRRCAAALRWR